MKFYTKGFVLLFTISMLFISCAAQKELQRKMARVKYISEKQASDCNYLGPISLVVQKTFSGPVLDESNITYKLKERAAMMGGDGIRITDRQIIEGKGKNRGTIHVYADCYKCMKVSRRTKENIVRKKNVILKKEIIPDNTETSNSSNNANLQQVEDVVYLKDGTIVKGIIVTFVPNTSIDIKKNDGNIYFYRMDEISKITRAEVKSNLSESSAHTQSLNNLKTSNYSEPTSYSNNSYSQQGKILIGGQVGVSFPVGDYGKSAETGFGLLGNFVYTMNRNIDITGTLGYLSWSGKSLYDYGYSKYERSFSDIPMVGGIRYYLNREKLSPYGIIELGLHFLGYSVEYSSNNIFSQNSASDSKTEFGFGIGGGFMYNMSNMKLDLNLKYNNISGNFFNHLTIMAGILLPLQ